MTFSSCSFPLRRVFPSITFLHASKPFSTGMSGTGEGSEGGSGVASRGKGDTNSGGLGDRGLEGHVGKETTCNINWMIQRSETRERSNLGEEEEGRMQEK